MQNWYFNRIFSEIFSFFFFFFIENEVFNWSFNFFFLYFEKFKRGSFVSIDKICCDVIGYAVAEGRPVRERRLPCCGIGFGWFLWVAIYFLPSILDSDLEELKFSRYDVLKEVSDSTVKQVAFFWVDFASFHTLIYKLWA